ncbi:MAG: glycosyltransferase [Desulfovibrio sp.]|jgi:glycosyltransferase involved in cell wall biosynthesis|nr:glycosyltransferase [Desulfovibrio sp.]
MKVAYLVGGLPFGGIERWLYDLCLEYGRTGLVRGRVFNLSGTGALLPEYRKAGIDLECVGSSLRAVATHRLDTALKLRGRLRAFRPDVIHTMHFMANHHGRIAALGLGIPVLVHLRNTKHEKKLVRRLSDKFLSYAATAYLAVSEAVARVVETDHNLAKRPVRVLYNALNPERLEAEPVDFAAAYGLKGPVVLAVGRYVPQKNLDLLIRAVGLLRGQGLDLGLVLVGEGPERSRLEALRDSLGLGRQVVLTGFRPDVPAFYRASRVFAMPSDFEGFPIAHLEAMYCGLPAVVSGEVPSLEIAAEACLVCRREPEDIAEKLGRILRDEVLRARLGERAARLAREHTMERYARTLYSVYETVRAGDFPFPPAPG